MFSEAKPLLVKIHRPMLILCIACFGIFGITSFFTIHSLVRNSIHRQANSAIDIFKASIREDILNGFEKEVFSRCQSFEKNTLVLGVHVTGLGRRIICNSRPSTTDIGFKFNRDIFFNPNSPEVAGSVQVEFGLSLLDRLVSGVMIIIGVAILLLLFGYWLISNYLVKRETHRFSELAELLSEGDLQKLENCRSTFLGEPSKEFEELCTGVESLAGKWRNYKRELVKNERLKAINFSGRLLAHDMKSPIGALKAVYQVFDEKPELARELLGKGITRLEKMVDEILGGDEFADSGAKKEATSVSQLLSVISKFIHSQYDQKSNITITFENYIRGNRDGILIDQGLVERAVINLIKNSIEAIGERIGFVSVLVTAESGETRILVKDNGPGISQSKLDKIFARNFKSEKADGTGLGLIQVKSAIEDHGGNFEIRTDSTGVTAATIKLPLIEETS